MAPAISGSTATPRPPYKLGGKKNGLTMFAADPEIASWVTWAAPDKAGAELSAMLAQRFLLADGKDMVVITSAADSPPGVDLAGKIYETLNALPWTETVALSTVTGASAKPRFSGAATNESSTNAGYRNKVSKTRRLWRVFAGAVPADNALRRSLERRLYRAQSIDFMIKSGATDPLGEAYLANIDKTITDEFAKIRLKPPRAVTFSTRRGKIPVAVYNGTDYPIKTRLDIKGKDFSFPDDMKQRVVLKPKENLVSYVVTAGFTGLNIVTIKISVGDFEIASQGVGVTVSDTLRYIVVGGTVFLITGFAALVAARRYRRS
jgi:hypothetical protein